MKEYYYPNEINKKTNFVTQKEENKQNSLDNK